MTTQTRKGETMKTETKVNKNVVKMMVGFYGTIEAAREAYTVVKATLKPSQVLWVAVTGQITATWACAVQYAGSVDAYFVLPS